MIKKICSKCKVEKDINMFCKDKRAKNGYAYQCKQCNKEYREQNKEKIKEKIKEYREQNKEYFKEYREQNKEYFKEYFKEYYKQNKEKIKEYREQNKEKIKEQRKEYYKEYYKQNKEKINEKSKVHYHNRRTRKLNNGGSFTKEQWVSCLEYFNYCCAYTGEPLVLENKQENTASIEHIVPVSKGGTSYIYNIIPTLLSVNVSKNNTDLLVWYQQQPFYSEERLAKILKWVELNS